MSSNFTDMMFIILGFTSTAWLIYWELIGMRGRVFTGFRGALSWYWSIYVTPVFIYVFISAMYAIALGGTTESLTIAFYVSLLIRAVLTLSLLLGNKTYLQPLQGVGITTFWNVDTGMTVKGISVHTPWWLQPNSNLYFEATSHTVAFDTYAEKGYSGSRQRSNMIAISATIMPISSAFCKINREDLHAFFEQFVDRSTYNPQTGIHDTSDIHLEENKKEAEKFGIEVLSVTIRKTNRQVMPFDMVTRS